MDGRVVIIDRRSSKGQRKKGFILQKEEKLIGKMKQGDRDAMGELISLYYPEILRYCLWHIPDRDLAQDAAQETFCKMIRYLDAYTHRGKFRAWLYRIAANTCADMQKRKWSTEVSMEETAQEIAYEEPGFARADGEQQLWEAVGALEEELREAVLLRYAQELTLREIGAVLHLPMRTVQSRLRRAIKKLRIEMKGERE